MNHDIPLQFTSELLQQLHISCHMVCNPQTCISSEIDLGLRKLLFNVDNYKDLLQNSMNDALPNTIYRFFDEYHCNYIFMRLPYEKGDRFFYIGPYLPAAPSEEQITKKAQSLELDDEQRKQFLRYYYRLPIVEDENLLLAISNTLGKTLWGADGYSVEYVDYMIPDRTEPVCVASGYGEYRETPLNLNILESNYANEKYLMDAVSQGKLHKVNAIASAVYNNGTEQRVADSLRNRKNYLIILNTLLRKAAEQGGVHPLHIDRISSSYAHKIEDIHSLEYSLHLQSEMIRNYCVLVKQHSLSKYSHIIGKTITLISYDLTADLSLKSIAEQLNVNPTYLSGLFRKECGCTLTDFVNKKRVEQAATLLSKTNKPVNVISYECGIADTNYFIKLFKKYTGHTPTQYRTQVGN